MTIENDDIKLVEFDAAIEGIIEAVRIIISENLSLKNIERKSFSGKIGISDTINNTLDNGDIISAKCWRAPGNIEIDENFEISTVRYPDGTIARLVEVLISLNNLSQVMISINNEGYYSVFVIINDNEHYLYSKIDGELQRLDIIKFRQYVPTPGIVERIKEANNYIDKQIAIISY